MPDMSALDPVYSNQQARSAEDALLARQVAPDELMKKAAAAVAEAAGAMAPAGTVLIVAGPGGNGGDGLYAGAHLSLAGHTVHALLVAGDAHQPALDTFRAAGGELTATDDYDLVIDAVAGLGSSRELDEDIAALMARGRQVLAIDAPTGVGTARSVRADATITFGAARLPHAVYPECGEVIIADIGLGAVFEDYEPVGYTSFEASLGRREWPEHLRPLADTGPLPDLLPGITDNKYTHGVTGIAAGSEQFPGAGILATAGAVNTTTSMVVTIGGSREFPEVVPADDVASARKVDAWVVGPGRGADARALKELETILDSGLPVIADADAITLIAHHPHLQAKLRGVVLTPHTGEFARLQGESQKSQQELSDAWGCHILLKGRITRITSPGALPVSVNTGNSFAATAGSGDVLAGIIGALLAKDGADDTTGATKGADSMQRLLLSAVAIHAHAAAHAARREHGYAPTRAMKIAEAISNAIASRSSISSKSTS